MRDDFKVGDHVEWNSEAGMVTGPAGEISLGMLWKHEEEQGDV